LNDLRGATAELDAGLGLGEVLSNVRAKGLIKADEFTDVGGFGAAK